MKIDGVTWLPWMHFLLADGERCDRLFVSFKKESKVILYKRRKDATNKKKKTVR